MKLKTKLSKLRHDGHITDAEYSIIINALNHQKPKERVIAEIKFDEDTLRKIIKDKVDELTTKFATQPCEDCISRQAAIDVVRKWFDKIQLNGDICLDGIISLPSITSQLETCEDAISREAIYEALSEWDEQDVYLPYHFKELVAELPSVTPWSVWIPVSEKLPEPLTAVLLTVRYKSSGCLTYQMGYWEDTLEKWEKWLEIGTLDDEFEILAWMELPEGYEEDSYE